MRILEGLGLSRVELPVLKKLSEEELDVRFNAVNYEDVKDLLGTGDLLLERGMERYSKVVRKYSRSWYSHTALVLYQPPAYLLELFKVRFVDPNGIYVFDCQKSTLDGREGGGQQIVAFDHWIDNFRQRMGDDCFFGWRKLMTPTGPAPKLPAGAYPGLCQCIALSRFIPYEKRKSQFLLAVIAKNQEDLSSVFCTEAIAWALRSMGVLRPNVNVSNFMPTTFSSVDGDVLSPECISGYYYESDIRLLFRYLPVGMYPDARGRPA